MKRDWDLVRHILIKLEEDPDVSGTLYSDDVPGYAAEVVAYHFKILGQAGIIEVDDISTCSGTDYAAKSLTWQGQEFLESIRKDTLWNKIKTVARDKSVDLSVDVIKTLSAGIIKALIV